MSRGNDWTSRRNIMRELEKETKTVDWDQWHVV